MSRHNSDAIFLAAIMIELERARKKFPEQSRESCALAAGEEYGELCQALLQEPNNHDRIYGEAVQLAVMALRVAVEYRNGDAIHLLASRAK